MEEEESGASGTFDSPAFNYHHHGDMLGIDSGPSFGGGASGPEMLFSPGEGGGPSVHSSCAIPIQAGGRRSPLMAIPKGAGAKVAVRLGGSDAHGARPSRLDPRLMTTYNSFAPHHDKVSAPMPSPNLGGWHLGPHREHLVSSADCSTRMDFDRVRMVPPLDEHTLGALSPGSPPFSMLSLSLPTASSSAFAAAAGTRPATGTSLQKIISASPRSFSESIFSFRTGSLSTTEEILAKQRRRKENHNAVERRRRDQMNVLIQRLSLLVTASPQGPDAASAERLNKGEVLEAAVKKILALNQACVDLAQRLAALEPNSPHLVAHQSVLLSAITHLPENLGDLHSPPDTGSPSGVPTALPIPDNSL